jgi:hypothetical protein
MPPTMNTNEITNDEIRRALLGFENSNPDESLEMRIFSDDTIDGDTEEGTLAESLSAAEDDLIDDFLRGDLGPEENARFWEGFLCTPERHRKLIFATALKGYLGSIEASEESVDLGSEPEVKPWFTWPPKLTATPVWSYAQAALMLFAVAGAAWMFVANLRLEGRITQLASDRVALEEQIESLREVGEAVSTSIATAWLVPGLLRGPGEVERVIVPEGSDLIRFQLDLGIDDYASYRAALHDAEGDEIWTQSKIRASETGETVAVTMTLPSELVPDGDYYFRLSGVTTSGGHELVGRYHFRVLVE